MSYKPLDTYVKEFVTSSPTTQAAVNADSLPAATANKNGTDDGAFTLTVTNIDTGRYKITGTVPSGYASGDVVNVSVAATVGGVAGKACVDTFQIDGFRLSDVCSGVGVNLTKWLGSAPLALNNQCVQSDIERWLNVAPGALVAGAVPAQVAGYAASQDPATLILDTGASGHNGAGSIGAKINAAGSASDPLANVVPGGYASGTAGFILGTNLNAQLSAVKAKTDVLPSGFPANFSVLSIDSVGRMFMAPTGLASVFVSGVPLPTAIRHIAAATCGKSSGAGSGTETYQDFQAATSFVVTIDSNGNRTAVSYQP